MTFTANADVQMTVPCAAGIGSNSKACPSSCRSHAARPANVHRPRSTVAMAMQGRPAASGNASAWPVGRYDGSPVARHKGP